MLLACLFQGMCGIGWAEDAEAADRCILEYFATMVNIAMGNFYSF
jgi:hypothetical protein